ncbi:MAG: hypothetical protein CMD99_07180 [Gammaproteobacteria bacterium]|nr:hypothetical protein [Gammaproteobacteria bacterium]|tara:strand:+ start:1802 stop:2197 length:396 start_codon:yes stop_codon:yes gene_type:complete
MKINHIGYVVQSLDRSAKFYCDNFGYSVKVGPIFVRNQKVNIVMLRSPESGDPDLELIVPVGKDSPAFNSQKRRLIINHICYQTKKYEETLARFEKKVVRPSMPAPVELFGGGRTFFAYLAGQLTEFLEEV